MNSTTPNTGKQKEAEAVTQFYSYHMKSFTVTHISFSMVGHARVTFSAIPVECTVADS